MKQLYLSLFILYSSSFFGQEEYKKVEKTDLIKEQLQKQSKTINSISSDFVQTKKLEILTKKIVSKGTFCFRRKDKICLNYLSPTKYSIVINGNVLTTKTDGKKNTIRLDSSAMLQQMMATLSACMSGDIEKIYKDYKIEFLESKNNYLANITPISSSVLAYISSIDIVIAKKDMSISKLTIYEDKSNYTEFEFINKQFNVQISDSNFAVR